MCAVDDLNNKKNAPISLGTINTTIEYKKYVRRLK